MRIYMYAFIENFMKKYRGMSKIVAYVIVNQKNGEKKWNFWNNIGVVKSVVQ